MSRAIYRYSLPVTDSQIVEMPVGAKIVHVGLGVNDGPSETSVWAEVDTDRLLHLPAFYRFKVVGTGHPLPDDCTPQTHVGSWVAPPFVWHAYMVGLVARGDA